jgi:class 3 adenylate cyclase
MAEESAELRAVMRRWLDAVQNKQLDTVQNLYSDSTPVLYVGSDWEEWWGGRDTAAVVRKHVEEMQGVDFGFEVTDIEAFQQDSVGWGAMRLEVQFEGQRTVPFRITFVFCLEDGIWKIVQTHNSVAVPNPDVMGVELTTTLEGLLEALGSSAEAELRRTISEGTVTLVFTDVEGSATWAERVGDEAWAGLISWHDEMIGKIAGSHGGTVVKTLGDGAMIAFDSTRQAARAAIKIQRAMGGSDGPAPLQLRIGVHIGDAVQTEDDYLGHAVNKAARIAAAANGGQIMVSRVVQAMLGDTPEFNFGDGADVELKGLPGVHEVAPLLWEEPS